MFPDDQESWASIGKLRRDQPDGNGFRPSNPEVGFHGQTRTNETHQNRTDPEATLSHRGQALTENRNGLTAGIQATEANSTAERTAALGRVDESESNHRKKQRT